MNINKLLEDKMKSFEQKGGTSVMLCSVCQVPLTDVVSMAAGMGPICHAKTRYSEKLSREDLAILEGTQEKIDETDCTFRTGVARIAGEETPRLVTILINKKGDIWMVDRSEYNSAFENNEKMSVAEAMLAAFYQVKKDQINSISQLVTPEKTDLKDDFKNFQSNLSEDRKTRENFVDASYPSFKSKKLLGKVQTKDRGSLIKNIRADGTGKAKKKWGSGEYTIATFMARLENSNLNGSKELLEVLQQQYSDIKPKDHGLTDDEISHGLAQAIKPLEKKIFNSLVKGKGDLLSIAQVYRNIKENKTDSDASLRQKFNELTS